MRMVIVCIGVILVFSCSNEDDMRDGVVKALGEPDIIERGGTGAYKYEQYIYLNKDIDRVYIFYKSAPGCGSGGNWYVEYVYSASYYGYGLYETPTIQHLPVESAPVGQDIPISAVVLDDEKVVRVNLFYRTIGAGDSIKVSMAVSDSLYTAKIPAEAVTPPGVEYFIQASDGDHSSQYPPKGYLTIVVTDDSAAKITTVREMIDRKKRALEIPGPEDVHSGNSPVGP